MRVSLEKVNGKYQGPATPSARTLAAASSPSASPRRLALRRRHQPRLGLARTKPFSIERLVWTGIVPFEIQEMKAMPDGFVLTFTKPVNAAAGQCRFLFHEDVYL